MTFENLKQLEREYEKESKKCTKNAYNKKVDDLNPKHFNRCDGDITAGKLDQLNEIMNIIKILESKTTEIGDNGNKWINGRDRKSTRLNSSHIPLSRMPSSA